MNAATVKTLRTHLPNARVQWQSLQLWVAACCAGGGAGRVLLHVLCACRDRQFRWHLNGIARELAAPMVPLTWRNS